MDQNESPPKTIEAIANVREKQWAAVEEISASAEEMSAQVEEVTNRAQSPGRNGRLFAARFVAQFKAFQLGYSLVSKKFTRRLSCSLRINLLLRFAGVHPLSAGTSPCAGRTRFPSPRPTPSALILLPPTGRVHVRSQCSGNPFSKGGVFRQPCSAR